MGNRPDEIFKAATRAIIGKRLWPGSKLSEQTLVDIFNVSHAVLRQAIIRLADDGLVTMERNRGAFVSRLNYREAMEIYYALTMLEQGVIGQLVGRMDARGWGEFRRHIEAQYNAVDDKNYALLDALWSGFHEVLVKLSGNRVVKEIHAQLIRRTALMRALVCSRFGYCGLLRDHDALVDLLEAGKVTEAQQLIDTYHRIVVRGYILDENIEPVMTPREALEPYVENVQQQKFVANWNTEFDGARRSCQYLN
jgi:DNA-binding GntR family transcriptional regulator